MPVIIGLIVLSGAGILGLRQARKTAIPIIGVLLAAVALFVLTQRSRR